MFRLSLRLIPRWMLPWFFKHLQKVPFETLGQATMRNIMLKTVSPPSIGVFETSK